jgi:hypothetical protein
LPVYVLLEAVAIVQDIFFEPFFAISSFLQFVVVVVFYNTSYVIEQIKNETCFKNTFEY